MGGAFRVPVFLADRGKVTGPVRSGKAGKRSEKQCKQGVSADRMAYCHVRSFLSSGIAAGGHYCRLIHSTGLAQKPQMQFMIFMTKLDAGQARE
jgi:hypothetical protein